MIKETPKKLPDNVSMTCYACAEEIATHLCRYRIGELSVQVCLCRTCMQIDTQQLLKSTIGIQDVNHPLVDSYLTSKKRLAAAS